MATKKAAKKKTPAKRPNPFTAKAAKADKAMDKKKGIKENSARDKKLDRGRPF